MKTPYEAARLDVIAATRNGVRFPLSRVAMRVIDLLIDANKAEFEAAAQAGQMLSYVPRTYGAGDIERAAEAVIDAFGWSPVTMLNDGK